MPAPQRSMPFRLPHSALQLALRIWPEESRTWGQALAAELHEIEKPIEALQWALGGLRLFTRASASHFLAWMKLPVGSRLSAASLALGTGAPILPKRSRLFTAALLMATAALAFLPQTQEAVSTVRATWQGYELWNADRRTLEKLAVRAEKEKDARTLAFVAQAMPQPELGMRLADKAVALDPSLTWIYASRFYRPGDVPPPPEWLARLHASDPGNAFISLSAADAIAQARQGAWYANRTPPPQEIESALSSDPQWVAQMETAFRAPRYHNYLHKHWDLICYVWNRDPSLSPAIIGYGLWAHRIPNLLNLRTYTNIEIHRARQSLADGHPDQAGRILEEIDTFASRMSQQAETDIERLIALELSRLATQEYKNLYAATGRAREVADASTRLQEIEKRQQSFRSTSAAAYPFDSPSFLRQAFLFQICAILLFVCGIIVALSFFLLEIRPRSCPPRRAAWQGIVCRMADYAPASLLILTFSFMASFIPIAHLFAQYRSASASIDRFRELSGTLWALMEIPLSIQKIVDPPLFWWLLTTALVIFAALLLFRLFTRTGPTPHAAP
jgi:hypothetical protein